MYTHDVDIIDMKNRFQLHFERGFRSLWHPMTKKLPVGLGLLGPSPVNKAPNHGLTKCFNSKEHRYIHYVYIYIYVYVYIYTHYMVYKTCEGRSKGPNPKALGNLSPENLGFI